MSDNTRIRSLGILVDKDNLIDYQLVISYRMLILEGSWPINQLLIAETLWMIVDKIWKLTNLARLDSLLDPHTHRDKRIMCVTTSPMSRVTPYCFSWFFFLHSCTTMGKTVSQENSGCSTRSTTHPETVDNRAISHVATWTDSPIHIHNFLVTRTPMHWNYCHTYSTVTSYLALAYQLSTILISGLCW